MEIIEYQLIRPDGTILFSTVAPADSRVEFGLSRSDPIEGEVISRYRSSEMPEGSWVNVACFHEGYPGPGELL